MKLSSLAAADDRAPHREAICKRPPTASAEADKQIACPGLDHLLSQSSSRDALVQPTRARIVIRLGH